MHGSIQQGQDRTVSLISEDLATGGNTYSGRLRREDFCLINRDQRLNHVRLAASRAALGARRDQNQIRACVSSVHVWLVKRCGG